MTLSATASEDCVLIRVVDDLVLEEMESLMVSVSLTGELTSVQLTQHTATILITDDDGQQLKYRFSVYCTYIVPYDRFCTLTLAFTCTCIYMYVACTECILFACMLWTGLQSSCPPVLCTLALSNI